MLLLLHRTASLQLFMHSQQWQYPISSMVSSSSLYRSAPLSSSKEEVNPAISTGGYESLIGNTPLLHLPHISSLLPNRVKIYVKMESMNPGGTGKDRAARSMILDAERRGELPPPLRRSAICSGNGSMHHHQSSVGDKNKSRDGNQSTNQTMMAQLPNNKNNNHYQHQSSPTSPPSSFSNIPSNIHSASKTRIDRVLDA